MYNRTAPPRVLWISDSPQTPSGFGNVTRFVCAGLAARGYRVDILGWQTPEAHLWEGCRVFPCGSDAFGSDAFFRYLVRERPDAVIALGDVWWLPYFASPPVRRQLELLGTPWMLYYPIDGDTGGGLPPSWIEVLREVDVRIAMSAYGREISLACGLPAEMIPHGVDTSVFAPPLHRARAKAEIDADGRFLILSDSRNQPRKLIPRLLDVIERLVPRVPNVLLHLHTDPDDEFTRSGYYSYDVRADVVRAGLERYVRFTPNFSISRGGGLALSDLARYYAAADVHLLASSGEGFGLPTLQAAAAGAVPAAGAYSASHELVRGHGLAIAIDGYSENEFGIRRATIDVDDAVEQIAALAHDPARLAVLSAASRAFALPFAWDRVLDRWDALLRDVGRRRAGRAFAMSSPGRDRTVTRAVDAPGGASITVKMLQREAGRLESSIAADVRRTRADVRIPAVPRGWNFGTLRTLRDPGFVAVAPGSAPLAARLRSIFPILEDCMIDPLAPDLDLDRCAQSILAIDLAGVFPRDLLVALAHFGTPTLGCAADTVAAELWPDAVIGPLDDPVAIARALLTDLPRNARLVERARRIAEERFPLDLDDLAARVRRAFGARSARRQALIAR